MKQAISYHIPKMEFRDEGSKITGRSITVFGGRLGGGWIGKVGMTAELWCNRDQIYKDLLSMRQATFFPTTSPHRQASIDQ